MDINGKDPKTGKFTVAEIDAMDGDTVFALAGSLDFPGFRGMSTRELRAHCKQHLSGQGRLVDQIIEVVGGGSVPAAASRPATPVTSTPAQPSARRPVYITYPPHEVSGPQFIGMTLAKMISTYRSVWGIPENVRVVVNGENARDMTRVLAEGDSVEMLKPAGDKGI